MIFFSAMLWLCINVGLFVGLLVGLWVCLSGAFHPEGVELGPQFLVGNFMGTPEGAK